MPESGYDDGCCAVNEKGQSLSVFEVRQMVTSQELCTPICYGDDCSNMKE